MYKHLNWNIHKKNYLWLGLPNGKEVFQDGLTSMRTMYSSVQLKKFCASSAAEGMDGLKM